MKTLIILFALCSTASADQILFQDVYGNRTWVQYNDYGGVVFNAHGNIGRWQTFPSSPIYRPYYYQPNPYYTPSYYLYYRGWYW